MSFFSKDTLSSSEHNKILKVIIKNHLDAIQPVLRPKMFMLGGQPGAGKTGVRKAITDQPQFSGSLIVDPDELRTYHPRYLQFIAETPDTAAGRVHPDASKWANELREAAIKKKVNIVLDTSLGGNPRSSVSAAKDAVKGGYDVEVHVAAVSIEASQQGVRGRFEDAYLSYEADQNVPKKALPPRNVPMSKQLDSYKKIPEAIEALAESGVVSRIRIADRSGKSLNDISGKFAVKKDGGKTSTKTLKEERTRPWTTAEIDHFQESNDKVAVKLQTRIDREIDGPKKLKLQDELRAFKEQGAEVVDGKITALASKVPKYAEWFLRYTKYKLPELEKS